MGVTPRAFQVERVCVRAHMKQKTKIKSLTCLGKLHEVPTKDLGLINREKLKAVRERGQWRKRGSRENAEDES